MNTSIDPKSDDPTGDLDDGAKIDPSSDDPVEQVADALPGGGRLDGPTADELADEAGGPLQVP